MVLYESLASILLLTSTNSPAVVNPYNGNHGVERQLLLAHSPSDLMQRSEAIGNLKKGLENALKLPCFMHYDACYQFRVKDDGSLVAVFVYNVGINKLNFEEEPTQLRQIVHIEKIRYSTIIDYNPAISTREVFWERFWKNPHNVSDVKIDENGHVRASMEKLFEEYLKKMPKKPKTKPRMPKQYKKFIKEGTPVNLFMPSTPKPKYLVPPKRP